MASPKFIADADLNDKIIAGVRRREPSIDFLNALDGGTRGLSDPEVLALAAASGRVLVSSDKRTMPAHFARFVEAHESPGVIIVPQATALSKAIEDIVLLFRNTTADEMRGQLQWIRRYRR